MAKKSLEDELEEQLMGDSEPSTPTPKEDLAEMLSEQLEQDGAIRDYRYLKISIEQDGPTDYFVHVEHQSHGFMNYMVSKVLKVKGVEFAAYKNTSLAPPELYIRIDGTRDIKAILQEALKLMRTEWKGMGNAVAAMKI